MEHRHARRGGCRSVRSSRRSPNTVPPLTSTPVIPCARELGIGIVAYSPLCRGLLTGAVNPAALPATDRRSANPRFSAENFSANMAACAQPLANIAGVMLFNARACVECVSCLKYFTATKGCTPAQLCLAWVHAQGEDVFPIPGTKTVSRLLEASAAAAHARSRSLTSAHLHCNRTWPQPTSNCRVRRKSSCVAAFRCSRATATPLTHRGRRSTRDYEASACSHHLNKKTAREVIVLWQTVCPNGYTALLYIMCVAIV